MKVQTIRSLGCSSEVSSLASIPPKAGGFHLALSNISQKTSKFQFSGRTHPLNNCIQLNHLVIDIAFNLPQFGSSRRIERNGECISYFPPCASGASPVHPSSCRSGFPVFWMKAAGDVGGARQQCSRFQGCERCRGWLLGVWKQRDTRHFFGFLALQRGGFATMVCQQGRFGCHGASLSNFESAGKEANWKWETCDLQKYTASIPAVGFQHSKQAARRHQIPEHKITYG